MEAFYMLIHAQRDRQREMDDIKHNISLYGNSRTLQISNSKKYFEYFQQNKCMSRPWTVLFRRVVIRILLLYTMYTIVYIGLSIWHCTCIVQHITQITTEC